MKTLPPAPLTIPKKGEATPAIASLETTTMTTDQQHQRQSTSSSRLTSRTIATIAVTVRLDESRYERMTSWGTPRRLTNKRSLLRLLIAFSRRPMKNERTAFRVSGADSAKNFTSLALSSAPVDPHLRGSNLRGSNSRGMAQDDREHLGGRP
jgi:hypothetical protein